MRLPREWRNPRVCLEVAECAREGGHGAERGEVSAAWVGVEQGAGAGGVFVGRGGRESLCARTGGCGDRAVCPPDTSPCFWRARPPGEVKPATAQALRLAAPQLQVLALGRSQGWGGGRTHILPWPRIRAALLLERGAPPEGRDSTSCPAKVSPVPRSESGLGSVNSQSGSVQSVGPSLKPVDFPLPGALAQDGERTVGMCQRAAVPSHLPPASLE